MDETLLLGRNQLCASQSDRLGVKGCDLELGIENCEMEERDGDSVYKLLHSLYRQLGKTKVATPLIIVCNFI